MNGELNVTSELGVGSTFEALIEFGVAPEPITKPIPVNVGTTEDLAGVRVLVAEDNLVNQTIISKVLGKYKTRSFFVADNGQIAFDKYCACPSDWDVVLLDCQMPVCISL